MLFPKLILDQRRSKKNGTFPLLIRVTHNRITASFAVGVSISKVYWDDENSMIKKSHPDFRRLSSSTTVQLAKIQREIDRLIGDSSFTLKNLKKCLRIETPPEKIEKENLAFKDYGEELVNKLLETGKTGNAIIYKTAINRLIAFSKNPYLTFEDIDYTLLDNFKNKLLADGLKANSISNYFRTLRAIYNKAIKQKLASRDFYPFTDLSFPAERTFKRGINKDDVLKFYAFNPLINSSEYHAKNMFILSFCLIGISFTDLAYLKISDIDNNRVEYRRRKTGKHYSINLTKKAREIISTYKIESNQYLLPILPSFIQEDGLIAKRIISQWIKTTNKYLKRISAVIDIHPITTYVARHTWATLAKRKGYSNELIAEALGHEYGNRITAIYLNDFEEGVIDNVNESVQQEIFIKY